MMRMGYLLISVASVVFAVGSMLPSAMAAGFSEPYHIGVWYFTLWNSYSHPMQVARGEKIYGRLDPWAGVRDYATGHGAAPIVNPQTGKPVSFADREPLLGFYDEMNQSVVDKQIEEAASEGVEFFAFYWYLDPETGREGPISAPVHKFFGSALRNRMKFVLAPSTVIPGRVTLDTWQRTIVPQLLNYMRSASYLRIDGRPVMIDFQIRFADGVRPAAYEYLRQVVRTELGAKPLILYLLLGPNTYRDLQFVSSHAHPDGFTCFNLGTKHPAEPYSESVSEWRAATIRQIAPAGAAPDPRLVYLPCGATGVDARPWLGVSYGRAGEVGSRPYVTGVTPALFRDELEQIRRFMDADAVRTYKTAILYAWNEWGEAAASIEPSASDGYAYADAVREAFGLIPRSQRP